MRRWLGGTLAATMLIAGCMGGGGPQRSPAPDEQQMRKEIARELHSEDMKDFISSQVRGAAGGELLEKALANEDGKEVLQKAFKGTLESTSGRQEMRSAVMQLMKDPEIQQAIQMAVQQTLQQMIARGAGGGRQQQAGGGGGGGGEGGGGGGGS